MKEYHKIQTMFYRDPKTNNKRVIEGVWAEPEFEDLRKALWVWDEKLDGTNIRVMWFGERDELRFGGKTNSAQIPSGLANWLNSQFSAQRMKEVFGNANACLYGEGVGEKIQKVGHMYGKQQHFVLFDVLVGDWWLRRDDIMDVALKLDLTIAPIAGSGTLLEAVEYVKSRPRSIYGDGIAEGIVARPAMGYWARDRRRIITKLKVRDFYGEVE